MNTQHAMLMSLEDSRCASRVVVDSDLGDRGGGRLHGNTTPAFRISGSGSRRLGVWWGEVEVESRTGPLNACRLPS